MNAPMDAELISPADLLAVTAAACAPQAATYQSGEAAERARVARLILARMSMPLETLLRHCAQPELSGLLRTVQQRLTAVLVALQSDGQTVGQTLDDWLHEFIELCAAGGIESECHCGGIEYDAVVAPHLRLAIARMIREAATNVLRHSGATLARLQITIGHGQISAQVSDNGGGCAETLVHGRGLLGMQRRAFALDGQLQIGTTGNGLWVRMTLPLSAGPRSSASPIQVTLPPLDGPSIVFVTN